MTKKEIKEMIRDPKLKIFACSMGLVVAILLIGAIAPLS